MLSRNGWKSIATPAKGSRRVRSAESLRRLLLGVPAIGRTLEGSFSAVSKLIFARTYAFESSRRDLHNALCDLPRTRLSNFYHKMTKSSSTLLECSQQGSKGSLRYAMWGYTGVSLQPSWTSRSRWYANEARRMFRMHLH